MSVAVTTEGATKKTRAELAEQLSFTTEQMQLMKDTVAKGVSDNEFLLFMHLAKTYGLDPFAKEVWCIKYGTQPATIFTSRDGYLKIASRDKQMNGIVSDAVCAGDVVERLPNGHVQHTYGNPRGELVGAYALVHRKDRAYPAYFYAPLKEYCAGSNPTWKKYPTAMIIKVAEAMALKRAFSISGLVTQEEIGLDMQAEQDAGTGAVVVTEPAAAEAPRVHVVGTVATQEEIDEREIAGHRTRLMFAKKLEDVVQIWSEVPKHLKPELVVDKEKAKNRFAQAPKAQPVRDEQLMKEFVEQPSLAKHGSVGTNGALTAAQATDAQRYEIQRLCNLQTIGEGEKADMLKVLYKLDEARAADLIFKLNNEIAFREGRDADGEWRQALQKFIHKYAGQLSEAQTSDLAAMVEDSGVHWQTIRMAMLNIIEGLKQAAALANAA